MKKTQIAMATLSIYAIATTIWIANDSWQDFQRDYLNNATAQAYQAGQTGAVNKLLVEAKKCETIEVFAGQNKVQLMNVACPQKGTPVATITKPATLAQAPAK